MCVYLNINKVFINKNIKLKKIIIKVNLPQFS